MLDQRRAERQGYITLKEAAQISNYSSDYIGQLVRSGKIPGEQVYSNLAWVTTPEAVLAYEQARREGKQPRYSLSDTLLRQEKLHKILLYGVISLLLMLLLFLQYVLYVSLDSKLQKGVTDAYIESPDTVENVPPLLLSNI